MHSLNQQSSSSKGKKVPKVSIQPARSIIQRGNKHSVSTLPFVDAPDLGLSITTTVQTLKLLNGVSQLLTAFPQHGTPTTYNKAGVQTNSIRTRIVIHYIDVDITVVGSQSNIVVSGDLFNFVRYAFYLDGRHYDSSATPSSYLTGVINGTDISDVRQVYIDERLPLPVQAYAGTYLVPQCKTMNFRINVNRSFVFYSVNAGYTQWYTEAGNLLLDVVSDSVASPSPTFSHNSRIHFSFI